MLIEVGDSSSMCACSLALSLVWSWRSFFFLAPPTLVPALDLLRVEDLSKVLDWLFSFGYIPGAVVFLMENLDLVGDPRESLPA